MRECVSLGCSPSFYGIKNFFKISQKTLAKLSEVCYLIFAGIVQHIWYPGVAKFGIALEWGSRGRWFESSHSDHAECPYRI